MQRYFSILTIAGSDSGGGAGIQADVKTISALGGYAMTSVTAITCQNTVGVQNVYPLPKQALQEQIASVMEDIGADALKIGMLHSTEIVEVVVDAIKKYQIQKIVLDPVMVAASGDILIETQTVKALVELLFPLVTVVTPNIDEALFLLDRKDLQDRMRKEQSQKSQLSADELFPLAHRCYHLAHPTASAMLLKGGHLAGNRVRDVLVAHVDQIDETDQIEQIHQAENSDESRQAQKSDARPQKLEGKIVHKEGNVVTLEWENERIPTRNIHGTGCSLSSAIAVYLAMGKPLNSAVGLAREYVYGALLAGKDIQLGSSQGRGPLNHFYAPKAMEKISVS